MSHESQLEDLTRAIADDARWQLVPGDSIVAERTDGSRWIKVGALPDRWWIGDHGDRYGTAPSPAQAVEVANHWLDFPE